MVQQQLYENKKLKGMQPKDLIDIIESLKIRE